MTPCVTENLMIGILFGRIIHDKQDVNEMLRALFLFMAFLFLPLPYGAVAAKAGVRSDSASNVSSFLTHSADTVFPASGILKMADTSVVADNTAGRYDYFFLQAISERQKGNSSAAFDLLHHCVDINPGAAEAYFYLAQYYLMMRDKDKAQGFLKRAVELSPDNSTFIETLANMYANNGKFAESIDMFERLMSIDKSREDILEILVRLYQQQADYDNAIRTLERMEEMEGKSERLSLMKCEIYSGQNNTEAELSEMKMLAEQYPNDLNYRVIYGDILMDNDRMEQAAAIFNEVLAEEPGNSRAQFSLRTYYKKTDDTLRADSVTKGLLKNKNLTSAAKVYILRDEITESENNGGDSTKILALFDTLRAMPRPDSEILMLHATYMNLKKMPADSIRPVLENVLEIEPDNAAARLQLLGYAFTDEDADRAIAICEAGRQYNSDEMAFYYYEGIAYNSKDDTDAAISVLKKGASFISDQNSSDIVSDYYSLLGQLYSAKGMMKESFAAYDSCLQWKSDNIMALNNYAYYLSVAGEHLDRAEKMSYKTIKAEPRNSTCLDTYAWILFVQQRYAEAKVYIDQALQCDSTASDVIVEHAGDIYAMNGDVVKALEYWQRALKDTPDRKILIRKIKKKKYIKE